MFLLFVETNYWNIKSCTDFLTKYFHTKTFSCELNFSNTILRPSKYNKNESETRTCIIVHELYYIETNTESRRWYEISIFGFETYVAEFWYLFVHKYYKPFIFEGQEDSRGF